MDRLQDRFKRLRIGVYLAVLISLLLPVMVKASEKKPLQVSMKKESSWKQGKYTYTLFNVTLKNTSTKATSNWAVTLTFNRKVKKTDGWNGKYSKGNKKTLKVTPMSYNRVIRAGDTGNFGFIVRSKGKPSWSKAKLKVTVGKKKRTYIQKKNGTSSSVTTSDGGTAMDTKNNSTTTSNETATGTTAQKQAASGASSADNGRLSVKGTSLVGSSGKKIVLKGVSTHGINWYPEYVNKDAFRTLRDEWGVNCIRLAMYTEEYNGYCSGGNKTKLENLICNGVQAASDLGMYVIIDWHILSDGNPAKHQSEAVKFFDKMSKKYQNYENVIYEICNEPNGNVSWKQIRTYAEKVISAIRKNDKKNVILVGTPNWSQEVDKAAADPIKGYGNIMYTFHFYAATHGSSLREKLKKAVDSGLPVFVSEFGISEASGSGKTDQKEAQKWMDYLKQKGISYVCWNLSNKNESCALLKSDCKKVSGFSDKNLSVQGLWYKYLS